MNAQEIYIVEDDTHLGNIYQKTLEHAGYTVHLSADGKGLMPKLQEKQPDLLILDLHVPYAWGPDTIAQVRAIPELALTKIMVTTADIVVGRELIAAGETVLIKPVSIDRLKKVAEELLAE